MTTFPAGSEPGPSLDAPAADEADRVVSRERLTRSAGAVSLGVAGSRVLGLVREMVLAHLFRTGTGLDAFYAAFRIPNLLRDMFAEGALSKAFVAVFTEVEERRGREAAARLANLVVNALVVVVGALTLLGIVYAPFIVDLMLPGGGFDVPLPPEESFGLPSKRELTVLLTRVMFPFLLLVSLSAFAMGLLNVRGRFAVPAWASFFFNLGSIVVGVAGYLLAPRLGLHPTVGMAVGVVAGGLVQLGWQLPALLGAGYRYRPVLSFRDADLAKVLHLFGPGALIAATVQVNVFINSIFASLGAGWLAWISQAFRLLHLPVGLVGVAVSVATLPSLSRSAARGDAAGFRDTFSYAMRLVVVFTVPATVGLVVLAEPIVRLIYEHGRFGPEDTERVAAALVFYALGLVSYAAVKIVTDGFYALKDIRAPLVVSVASMVFHAGLNWLFVLRLGMDHRGLALATSCTMTVSLALLWLLLRRRSRLGGLGGGAVASLAARTAVASAAMGLAAAATVRGLDGWLGHESVVARLAQVGGGIGIGLGVLYLALRALGVDEMRQALAAMTAARSREER